MPLSLIPTRKEQQAIERARRQRGFSFLRFSPDALLADIRQQWFSDVTVPVEWYFIRRGSLACTFRDCTPIPIYIHELLNHEGTPVEVMSTVFKHELLHHVIPPREVDGKTCDHPPEFREHEKRIAPERDDAWLWINENFAYCLKRMKKEEGIKVLSNWQTNWIYPRQTIEELRNAYPT